MALKLTSGQARRAFILCAAASIMTVAGCQSGPRRPIGPQPGEPLPAPAGQTYNGVAVIVPLTGPDGPVGTSISNAAKLALIDTGEKSLRVSVYDSAAPGGAAAAAQRAIAEGNRLILGPLLAEDVRAAAPVARQAGVPIIAYSNDEGVAGNGVYLMGFTPDQSISRVVGYARSRGVNRFGAMVPTGLYGERAGQALVGAVRKAGGRLVAMETYHRSLASDTAAARRLNAKGELDAVLIGDASRMAALASPALKAGRPRVTTTLTSDSGSFFCCAFSSSVFMAASKSSFCA